MCFLWCHFVSTSVLTRAQNVQTSSPRLKKEPIIVHLQSECEVQHFLGVNKLKSRTVTEMTTGPLTSYHSLARLNSSSWTRSRAATESPRPDWHMEKSGAGQP